MTYTVHSSSDTIAITCDIKKSRNFMSLRDTFTLHAANLSFIPSIQYDLQSTRNNI